ncbi:ATP-binding cassette domain-containing protein [Marinobacterium arenosum]|uniref:ATP-binding cassette domain-containing protein n=1 Tax=Marinobacterium arenosum TaxID=2862496 RepID=UPI001C943157|nr:ATP-binding cassette domain-containing protein [Marinobacterium arenosum]MBY4677835.1 ATP-binding cassette domain-containing protein [Marinobacterium arenosum]
MLEIDNLRVKQGAAELHYNLRALPGELLAIQGRSGVGKSTLLHAIAGFLPVAGGDIRWKGRSLLKLTVEQRPVSLLFQDHNLFEHINVWHNLRLGMPAEQSPEPLHQAAEVLQVTELLQRKPSELSGGQRQRIGLIRALLRPEPIVLLDEPFAELDPQTRQLAAEWSRATAKNGHKTLLLVTHQDEDVERVADRALQL